MENDTPDFSSGGPTTVSPPSSHFLSSTLGSAGRLTKISWNSGKFIPYTYYHGDCIIMFSGYNGRRYPGTEAPRSVTEMLDLASGRHQAGRSFGYIRRQEVVITVRQAALLYILFGKINIFRSLEDYQYEGIHSLPTVEV